MKSKAYEASRTLPDLEQPREPLRPKLTAAFQECPKDTWEMCWMGCFSPERELLGMKEDSDRRPYVSSQKNLGT